MAKILVVDDEMGIRELLSEILSDEGHDILLAENATAARAARAQGAPDLVLLDIWMPDTDGVTLLREWSVAGQLTMPVIMMSGHGTIDTAVEATRIGAMDFLEKPIALQKLLAAVRRGLQRQPLPAAHLTVQAAAGSPGTLAEQVEILAARLDSSRLVTLVCPESGLSAFLVRLLRQSGTTWLDLAHHPGAVDVAMLESAEGGVLYVPELGELSRMQQKSLAFVAERLERHQLRLLVATRLEQDELVEKGWEPVLVQRLFAQASRPPGFSDLRDELPELARAVLADLVASGDIPTCNLADDAVAALAGFRWNDGFAELRNALRNAFQRAKDGALGADAVAGLLRHTPALVDPHLFEQPLREAREAFERIYFEHHLELAGGNMTRLAERTGLERTHLYRKLKQLGLQAGKRGDDA